MRLTETEAKANAMEIKEKNCLICVNGWCGREEQRYVMGGETITIPAVHRCKSGLTFPSCRGAAKGFKCRDDR